MRRLICIILLYGFTCVGWARVPEGSFRKSLTKATDIQGYACAKGYAWFYRDGHLKSCAVERNTDFGVAKAPAGSWITLDSDGKPKILQLVRDTLVLGYKCRGGNQLLGPSEGATTAFYPSGKLKECWLADEQEVQGIPCARSGMFSGDSSVQFSESGKLRSCKLSRDYGGLKQGQRFVQSR